MINFDSLTLKAFVEENAHLFREGRIQKVQQPSRNELLLGIRSCGKSHKLYISVDPKYPHVCFLTPQGEEQRGISIPQKPPMFCMLLRKHMEGVKIVDVRQPDHERILEIYFESYNELGARVPLVLAIELMGKYSNAVLYSYETNVIMGCAHAVSAEKSRERELYGGLPYIYPPKQKKVDIRHITKEQLVSMAMAVTEPYDVWLNSVFYDVSRALAKEVLEYCGIQCIGDCVSSSVADLEKLYTVLCNAVELNGISAGITPDYKLYSIVSLDKSKYNSIVTVNTMLDSYFGYHVNVDLTERLRNSLQSTVRKEIKKLKNTALEYEKSLASTEKGERYRQFADLIMANLYRIPGNASDVSLENFYDDNKAVNISLDSTLSASENAQKYYKLYNKSKNAYAAAESLLANLRSELDYMQSVYVSIQQCSTRYELGQIKSELASQGYIKSEGLQQKKQEDVVKLDEFISSDGFTLLLGKNNKQNDYLISKVARQDDIWVHTRDIPGSHVLIKVPDTTQEVPEQTIHDAVLLAAYYSQARGSSMVPVAFTKRRYLKKPSGAKPGFVIYSHEKILYVNPDEKFLPKIKLY